MTQTGSAEHEIELRVPPSSKVLNQIAEEVRIAHIQSSEIQDAVDSMLRVAHGRQGDSNYPTLVGLAAPQLGISKRIIIVGVDADGAGGQPTLQAFINPVIIHKSDETEDGREGCFSTSRVCGIVARSKRVTLKALDRDGVEVIHELEGFPARVVQHEVDHLDGVRFPDRITDDNKLHWVEEAEFGQYRKHWQEWPIHCTRDKWQAIKTGS